MSDEERVILAHLEAVGRLLPNHALALLFVDLEPRGEDTAMVQVCSNIDQDSLRRLVAGAAVKLGIAEPANAETLQ